MGTMRVAIYIVAMYIDFEGDTHCRSVTWVTLGGIFNIKISHELACLFLIHLHDIKLSAVGASMIKIFVITSVKCRLSN